MLLFYFNYSVLRFCVYAIGLGCRLLLLPARVAVERYVPPPYAKVFLFCFSFLESVGGII